MWNPSDNISAVVTAEHDRTHKMKANSTNKHSKEEIMWRSL